MSNNDEFADAIEAGSSGDAWDIEKQPVIFGTFKAKKQNVGPNGSNMYMIQEDDKEAPTGVWGSAVLDGRFEEIPVGSRVKIEYLGKEKSQRGTTFKNYKVVYVPNKDLQAVNDAFPGAEVA